jgi:hypothetical protein
LTVEAESEFVEVVIEMLLLNISLMCANQRLKNEVTRWTSMLGGIKEIPIFY